MIWWIALYALGALSTAMLLRTWADNGDASRVDRVEGIAGWLIVALWPLFIVVVAFFVVFRNLLPLFTGKGN